MNGFKHILAATDLSDCAANALDHGKMFALKFGAHFSLLHASGFAPAYASMYSGSSVAVSAAAIEHDAARIALEEFHALQLYDLQESERLVVSGRPADAVLASARAIGADLITVGTSGRSGSVGARVGSVAEAVIRDSDRPVLTVPCKTIAAVRAPAQVLLSVYRTRVPREAFELAAGIASAFDAELLVLGVVSAADATAPHFDHDRMKSWAGSSIRMRTKIAADRGSATEQVLWHARQESADLVVIGLRQKELANPKVLPASTKMLIRHSPSPVLTVPLSPTVWGRI